MNDLKLFDDSEFLKDDYLNYKCKDCENFFNHMYTDKLTYCNAFPAKRRNAYGCLKVKRLQNICEKFKPKHGGQKVKLTLLLTMILLFICCTNDNNICGCNDNHNNQGSQNEGVKITYKLTGIFKSTENIKYVNNNQELVEIGIFSNWERTEYFQIRDSLIFYIHPENVDSLIMQIFKSDTLFQELKHTNEAYLLIKTKV